ncbi:MAG: TetR/AcrR family transcriptional regulator [Bacillus sp. (in: firmicutes)]
MSTAKEIDPQAITNLKHAMMSLLVKKDIRYIKTKDITKQAQVSRTILFHYYKDKYALFNDIVEEMKIELANTIFKTLKGKECNSFEQINQRVRTVLHFVSKNHFFFHTLMDRNTEPYVNFHQFFLQSCKEKQGEYTSKKNELSAHYQALYYYAVSLYWIKEEKKFSPDYIL